MGGLQGSGVWGVPGTCHGGIWDLTHPALQMGSHAAKTGIARHPWTAPAPVTALMAARTSPTAAASHAGQGSSAAHWAAPASHPRGCVMATQTVLTPAMSLAVVRAQGLHHSSNGGEGWLLDKDV